MVIKALAFWLKSRAVFSIITVFDCFVLFLYCWFCFEATLGGAQSLLLALCLGVLLVELGELSVVQTICQSSPEQPLPRQVPFAMLSHQSKIVKF